jgi:hypothetical protein
MHDRESGSEPALEAQTLIDCGLAGIARKMKVRRDRAASPANDAKGLAARNVACSDDETDVRKVLIRAGPGRSAECPTPTLLIKG